MACVSTEEDQDEPSPKSPKELLGAWLDDRRLETGQSRRGLAAALRTDKKNVYRWLDGESEPGGLNLLSLFAALSIGVDPEPPEEIPLSVNPEIRRVGQELLRARRELDTWVDLGRPQFSAEEGWEATIDRRLALLEKAVADHAREISRSFQALTRAIELLENRLDDEDQPGSAEGAD